MALGQQITDAGVAAFDEEEYVETVKTLEDDREFHWGEVRDILAFMMEGWEEDEIEGVMETDIGRKKIVREEVKEIEDYLS